VIVPGASLDSAEVVPAVARFLQSPYAYSDMTGMQLRLAAGRRGQYTQIVQCGAPAGGAIETPRWVSLAWDADEPPDTIVQWRFRTADTATALARAPWIEVPHGRTPPVALDASIRARDITPGLLLEVGVELGAWGSATELPRVRRFEVVHVCTAPLI
jgi:hypothetical protein